eukprot:scaffold14244_cov96-Skeletonema_dohrnii-CCMP3373.AAC.1
MRGYATISRESQTDALSSPIFAIDKESLSPNKSERCKEQNCIYGKLAMQLHPPGLIEWIPHDRMEMTSQQLVARGTKR